MGQRTNTTGMFVFVASAYALSAWTQLGLDIDGENALDESGYSVAMSFDGSRVAIGAIKNHGDDGTKDDSGHVRVYDYDGTNWNQIGDDIDGENADDYSGWSVSMSGDGSRVAISAYTNDGNSGTKQDSGHVRVFQWGGTSWTQLGSDIEGVAAYDYSGSSVALSSDGSRVAIGATKNDGDASDINDNRGHVRVFQWMGGFWIQLGTDIDGENAGDNSGVSVAMSSTGTRVVIGAYANNVEGTKTNGGHVRVFQWGGTSWTQVGLDIDGENALDYSGYSVAMSSDGSRVAIGAYTNDGDDETKQDSGHVRVFQWNGNTWNQIGDDIDGENADDHSGYSVAMSSDGTKVAIGARQNDGDDETKSNSGHVRVWQWDGSTWTKIGPDIDGENAGDASGYSVAMSSDGTKVAIGATMNHGEDGTKDDSGHVRVYEFKSTQEDDGLSTGAIVGIAVGATAGAVAIGAAAYYAVPLLFTGGKYKPVGQPFL